jgi:hypothetical protein
MGKFITRSKYLAYYFKKLEFSTFSEFLKYASQQTGKSRSYLFNDAVKCVYKYNIGLMDYFTFHFYEMDHEERNKWVGTGYKYEFDLRTNPKNTREILENKIKFYETYTPFIKHSYCTISDLRKNNEKAKDLFKHISGKIVVKDSLGQCGFDVEIINTKDYTLQGLIDYMQSKKFDLAENFIIQHPAINQLSPSGLNTVRMMTMINDAGGVDILGARMRITVNSHVDNLASGNIACSIDLDTGKINGNGFYSDITKEPVTHHPVTGVELKGFQVPMWQDIMDTTKNIALFRPENRGVGWDVALTENGPDFIEGNHNWCKILWQLPVGEGLKHVLDSYK